MSRAAKDDNCVSILLLLPHVLAPWPALPVAMSGYSFFHFLFIKPLLSLSVLSLHLHRLAMFIHTPPPPLSLYLFPFPHSSLTLSLGHSCGDLSEWLCWLIGQWRPYFWGLSAGLQSARAAQLSSLTTQVAPFGLNELWRVPAMPACPTLRRYTQTHAGLHTLEHTDGYMYSASAHAAAFNTLTLTAMHPCVPTWFVTLHQ